MSTTIRRNAFKKIETLLAGCEIIREFKYDDMGDIARLTTAEKVLATGKIYEFDRVYVSDDGVVVCSIHRNWSFTAYPTAAVAAKHLTPEACAKYGLVK